MTKILIISASYRSGGTIDQAIGVAAATARAAGAEIEVVQLRELPLKFCLNCRACTQAPGDAPGRCVLPDDMPALLAKIEAADALILASPTNFHTVTALFKRFMERLVVYAFWPWGAKAPQARKRSGNKRAVLLTSAAAPSFVGRWIFASLRQLGLAARTMGAKPVARVFIGMASMAPQAALREADRSRIVQATHQLLA